MRMWESVVATVLLTLWACNQIPQPTERKTVPVVDSSGEVHIYKTSVPLRLDNDYALYCMEHYHWETISSNAFLTKNFVFFLLFKIYIVREVINLTLITK